MIATILFLALAGDDKAAADAVEKFKAEMKNPSAPARATAFATLARTPHEKTLKAIAPFLGSDVNAVRIAAARAIASFVEYRKLATPMLVAALSANAKEPEVAAAIYEALGKVGEPSVVAALHRGFEEKDAKVAGAALLAAGELRHLSSIDAIIELMKKLEKHARTEQDGGAGAAGISIPSAGDDPQRKRARDLMPVTIKALQALTGEKWASAREWQIWWSRRKATFKLE